MGLKFKDITKKREVSIKELKGKVLAVDSMNLLYQFLTTIRAADGSVLTDKEGRVTSHLIGLFNRTTSLMEEGLKLVFVFDGRAPEIKQKTWEKRTEIKKQASLKLKEAKIAGDLKEMKKFASRTVILNQEMIKNAQKVIQLLGLPIIQAPSEGEAQTAYLVKKGDAYASVSQDYDNLIFGCPLLIRNLSIVGRRKKTGKFGFTAIKPEKIQLQEVLEELKLTLDQLIILAILSGTDYNPGGIKGIGPKKGLKLIQDNPNNFDAIFAEVEWTEHYPDLDWKEIFHIIKEMPTTDNYALEWKKISEQKLLHLLVKEYGFNEERVKNKLDKLKKEQEQVAQKGLGSFF